MYAHYSKLMLHPSEDGERVEPVAKDLRLLRQASAGRQIRLSLADQMAAG